MKQNKIYLFAATALLLAACNSNDEQALSGKGRYPADNRVRIAVEANAPVTRAASVYEGTDLALTLDYGNGDKYTASQVKWTRSGTTWTPTTQMLWKDATTPCKIYAFAPTASLTTMNKAEVTFTLPADQSAGIAAADFVSYYNASFVPGSSLTEKQALNIAFSHVNAKITVQLSFGDEFGGVNPTVESIELGKCKSAMRDDPANSYDIDSGSSDINIKMHKVSETAFEAIIMPETTFQDYFAQIHTTTGTVYEVQFKQAPTFASGTAYTIPVKIGKDMATVGTVNVVDWNNVSDIISSETDGLIVYIDPTLASDLADMGVPIINGSQLDLGNLATVAKLNAITKYYPQAATGFQGIEYLHNITELQINTKASGTLDLSKCNQLVSISLSNEDAKVTEIILPTNKTNLQSLRIDNSIELNLSDLSSYVNLERLDLGMPTLPANLNLALPKLTKLNYMNLAGKCSETTFDVSKNTLLTLLLIASNITSLDVSHNTALTGLYCVGNRLTALDITPLTQLKDLHCGMQTSDGTTAQPLTLTLTSAQNTTWESSWKSLEDNTNVTVVVK